MRSTQMGNVFLLGKDSHIWSEDEDDLIALRQREGEEPFHTLMSDTILQWFHLLIGHRFRVASPFPVARGPEKRIRLTEGHNLIGTKRNG